MQFKDLFLPKIRFVCTKGYCAPSIAHAPPYSDACYDLYSPIKVNIAPGETVSIDVGVSIQLPKDTHFYKWEAQIRPRSSMRKVGVVASFGTIDSGYRGEIGCILHNHSSKDYMILPGDRVCQIAFYRMPKVYLTKVDYLNKTDRGSGRYGSSGK